MEQKNSRKYLGCATLVKTPLPLRPDGPCSLCLPQGHLGEPGKWVHRGEPSKDTPRDPPEGHQRQFTKIKGKNIKTSILFNLYIKNNWPRQALYVSHHWRHLEVHMSDASCHLEPLGMSATAWPGCVCACVFVFVCVWVIETLPFFYLFSGKRARCCLSSVTMEEVFNHISIIEINILFKYTWIYAVQVVYHPMEVKWPSQRRQVRADEARTVDNQKREEWSQVVAG